MTRQEVIALLKERIDRNKQILPQLIGNLYPQIIRDQIKKDENFLAYLERGGPLQLVLFEFEAI